MSNNILDCNCGKNASCPLPSADAAGMHAIQSLGRDFLRSSVEDLPALRGVLGIGEISQPGFVTELSFGVGFTVATIICAAMQAPEWSKAIIDAVETSLSGGSDSLADCGLEYLGNNPIRFELPEEVQP